MSTRHTVKSLFPGISHTGILTGRPGSDSSITARETFTPQITRREVRTMSDEIEAIESKRDSLESLAEKDLPASDIAATLLEIAEGSK